MALNQNLDLFAAQARAVRAAGRELLVGKEPCSGASHLLRAMALLRAAAPRTCVVIAGADEEAVRRDHMEGPSGLWGMLEEAVNAGAVEFEPGGVARFKNVEGGSSALHVTTWEGALRRFPDVLLIDDADQLPYGLFQKLRDRVLRGPATSSQPGLVLVAARPGEGWIRDHWAEPGRGGRVDLPACEIPEHLREQARIAPPTISYGDFIARACPTYPFEHKHCLTYVDAGQRVLDGEITRLLVMAPPRHHKSLSWTRLLPACWLHQRPAEWTSVISADDDLALTFSKDARSFYAQHGGLFRVDAKAAALWRTLRGGGMWARTVQGGMGFGFKLGLIDDPFKDFDAGCDPGTQERVEKWVLDTYYSRRELDGGREPAIVVIQHRMHERDLIGRLLEREKDPATAQGWTVLDLPAIRRAKRVALPPSVHVLPDWRSEGEALCPKILDVAELDRMERSRPISHAALYQQDPEQDQGGGLFDKGNWRTIGRGAVLEALRAAGARLSTIVATLQEGGELPLFEREVRSWDFAFTERGRRGDFTASTRAGRAPTSWPPQIIYLDAKEDQIAANRLKEAVLQQAREDGPHVEVCLPLDPAAGKYVVLDIEAGLVAEGFTVVQRRPVGEKRVRATPHAGASRPVQPAGAGPDEPAVPGRVLLLHGAWNALFRERHHKFTGAPGGVDDLVDAASDSFNELDLPEMPPAQIFLDPVEGEEDEDFDGVVEEAEEAGREFFF